MTNVAATYSLPNINAAPNAEAEGGGTSSRAAAHTKPAAVWPQPFSSRRTVLSPYPYGTPAGKQPKPFSSHCTVLSPYPYGTPAAKPFSSRRTVLSPYPSGWQPSTRP